MPVKKNAVALICAFAIAIESPLGFQSPYRPVVLAPADEGTRDASFAEFRQTLLGQLASTNVSDVVETMTPELAAEYRSLHPEEVAGLRRALSLGGAFTDDRGAVFGRREFCAPYAYSNYPRPGAIPDDLRAAIEDGEAWVVLGAGVAVRERPSIKSRVLARLRHILVHVNNPDRKDESGAPYIWQMVQLPSGKWGWVENSLLWGPLDYRACFARIDGRWRMTVFERGGIP